MSDLDVQLPEGGDEGGGEEGGGYGDQSQESSHEGVSASILAEAREGGWRPKEEMRDPSRYVDPETFVKRGHEILPLLNKSNERLKAELAKMKLELDENKAGTKKLQEYQASIEVRAYDRALKELKLQKRGALEAGDLVAASDIDEEIAEFKESKPVPAPEVKAEPAAAKLDPVMTDWMEDNKNWFNDDNPDMMDYANAAGMRIRRQNPDGSMVGQKFLDEVMKAVKKQFPEKFGSRRAAASAVEGGGGGGAGRSNGDSKIADLPVEARKAYRELATEKWYQDLAKSQKMTTEQLYIKDYQ